MKLQDHPLAFLFKEWEELKTASMIKIAARVNLYIDVSDPTGAKEAFQMALEELARRYDLCLGEAFAIAQAYYTLAGSKMLPLHDVDIQAPPHPLPQIGIPTPSGFRPAQSWPEKDKSRSGLSVLDALNGNWKGFMRRPNWTLRLIGLSWRKTSVTFRDGEMILVRGKDSMTTSYSVEYRGTQRPRLTIQPKNAVLMDVVLEHSNCILKLYRNKRGEMLFCGSFNGAYT